MTLDGLCNKIVDILRSRPANLDWDGDSRSRKEKMDLQWYLGEETLDRVITHRR